MTLQSILREILGTSPWEAAGVILGLAYLLLAVRRSLWCWAFAFSSSTIYVVLTASRGLYMQALLNAFYVAMAVYGYIEWRRGRDGEDAFEIRHWSLQSHLAAFTVLIVATVINGYVLSAVETARATYLDAFVTWGSVITTWMVARKVLENWLYWIVVDAVAAYLYFSQGLKATAVLFLIYVGIVIHGYVVWLRNARATSVDSQDPIGAAGESR